MIRNAADLLKKFIDRERKVLDAYELSHGPTIGSMYEGLTREMLDKSIPTELGLQVVSGFAFFAGQLSGEIDCMVVRGTGEEIPYTGKYKWHISDVIAVFEVKKTLSADEIADSYDHLRTVSRLYSQYVESEDASGIRVDITWPRRIFSQMTGQVPPAHNEVENLPFDLQLLYHTLVTEYLGPIRIVMGHHGWKKEKTLRDHIVKRLQDRLEKPSGMGAGSFPQLIIGGEYALVKMNGFPYVGPLLHGMWPLLASSNHNPLRLLLELLFTKLDCLYSTNLALDDSNEQESMSSCLCARAIKRDGGQGWEYMYNELSSRTLKERGSSFQWHPSELTNAQFVIVNRLCAGEEISIGDPEFVTFAGQQPGGRDAFVNSLTETHLIAIDSQRLRLTTVNCTTMITSEGKFVAGENNAGQMEAWLGQKQAKPKSEWKTLHLRSPED